MTGLEQHLAEIEPAELFPPAPDVYDVVLAHIPARGPAWTRRLAPAIVAATLAVTGTALAASPGLRNAIQDLFSLRGVVIHRETKLPRVGPAPNLHLGTRVTPARASSAAGFHVLRPPLPGLAFYHDATFPTRGGKVSVVWSAGRLVLTEFRASSLGYMDKTATGATVVQAVRIDGSRGYWLAGAPHEQVYRRADGDVAPDTLRLAGNTLVWEDGPLTLRLEGARTKRQALRIARSLR
jgi:hypothetical protein